MTYAFPSRSPTKSSHQTTAPSPLRHGSTASTSSSEPPSRTSTVSSHGSNDFRSVLKSHRRGESGGATSPTKEDMSPSDPSGTYQTMRSMLRPLPQAPVSPPSSPDKATMPVRTSRNGHTSTITTREPTPPPSRSGTLAAHPLLAAEASLQRTHSRSKSHEQFALSRSDGSTSPTKSMAHSLAISRSDSVRAPTHRRPKSVHFAPQLDKSDLEDLGKSKTEQLRALSKFATDNNDDDFTIKSADQEVVGMHGRRRLQRGASVKGKKPLSGWAMRTWMDQQRQFLQAYEYLCHIGEAKQWIEDIIKKQLPPVVQLEEALRDGVTLAEIVQAMYPKRRIRIFRNPKLQYRHSDNIDLFFQFVAEVELPELFRFELVDLYEKKNIPKVIYCIHALSWLLFRKGIVEFRIGNLVGQLQFEHHELEEMQKGLDKSGVNMPNFSGMSANFGEPEPEPEPEPVETEQERIERELAENEAVIADLQAQIRGAMERVKLGDLMQVLWDNEAFLVDLQSRVRGDFARQIADYKIGMKNFAVNLQSAARGFAVRSQQRRKRHTWKSQQKEILVLQSLVRARKARTEVKFIKSQVQRQENGIRLFQAAVKGALKRRDIGDQYEESRQSEVQVKSLQAAIRGALARKRADDLYTDVMNTEVGVQALQSAIRGALLRKQVDEQFEATLEAGRQVDILQASVRGMLLRRTQRAQVNSLRQEQFTIKALQGAIRGMAARGKTAQIVEHLSSNEANWTGLQADIRGRALRSSMEDLRQRLHACEAGIVTLQSVLRGIGARTEMHDTLDALDAQSDSVCKLQSAIRGSLARKRHLSTLEALEEASEGITDLQSQARGFAVRDHTFDVICKLRESEDQITEVQSLGRAFIARASIGRLFMQLEPVEEGITELQNIARGKLIRTRFQEKKKHYRENMEKVIKVQSFFRARQQGEAYKSLTTGKNPPVNTVKNFVHLLNDSDVDFDEEIEFERLRKTVVQHIRQNEMAEQYIDQLDIKIALLVKNKITLDEVVKHQRHFGGHVGNLLSNKELASKDPFDLRALNKNSRRKLEHYQELFFILQTQPVYLARLFRKLREQGVPDQEGKRIEQLIMGLFGFTQKRREEYYLLKLMAKSIREEVDTCESVQDYLRGNFFWSRLLNSYIRSSRDRKYLRDLLNPLIMEIMENQDLDLESDPLQIYRSAINNEELRTGRRSQRPQNISREEAINDLETRDTFIANLKELRDIADQMLNYLEDLLHKMPYGMRFVTQQQFEALAARFPHEDHAYLLQIVGHWLWKTYITPALVAPETWAVIDRGLSFLQKRNLGEVSKVVNQIVSGRLFGGENAENVYLQPLNPYITEAVERMQEIWTNLITLRPIDSQFDIDEFNDLYNTEKPTLYIKLPDIFAIHQIIANDLPSICTTQDDTPLREILRELGSARSNEYELSGVSTNEISLTLNPKFHEIEDPDAPIKALYMETKRCVLYIIRIQTGPDLMSIMIKPVTDDDEDRWAALIHEEMSLHNTKRAYTEMASSLLDITTLTYTELKRTALSNILKLEQAGRITRGNQFQDLLNEIALDIRTKHRRRIQRSREIENVRATLSALDAKSSYLDGKLKSYNDYIEQAMLTLQTKKGKKRFLLPFTKQYNHERELQRRGQVPRFGSFKYSARTLLEKGVLVSWRGHTDRERGLDKTNITISCDEVGVFTIEGSQGSTMVPGASAVVPLDDLLGFQFENMQFVHLFGDRGGASGGGVVDAHGVGGSSGNGPCQLNVNLLLHLIFKKFYRDGGA
ncbi:ras GTPase-activating protein family IQGAP [Phyllosticta capitalensis]|uniref:Ras GTPase-activating protein family IQGAP n=1 Tax=Phyllosticta capitalensis TaxID=121624 RepID=A0ABR1YVJ7_9PEZI